MSRRSSTNLLRRMIAAGSAALVLMLTVFAASPGAHEWLHPDNPHAGHDHGSAENDDRCAIVLFASGVSLHTAPLAVMPPTALATGVSPATAAEIFLVTPRYLRQPERGPPAS